MHAKKGRGNAALALDLGLTSCLASNTAYDLSRPETIVKYYSLPLRRPSRDPVQEWPVAPGSSEEAGQRFRKVKPAEVSEEES